jgi:hypothetical protein
MRFHRPDVLVAILLLCAGGLIVATAAVAQGASPLTFLETVYKPYRSNNHAKAIDLGKPEVIRRHFVPALAKAMVKDQVDARKRNDVPLLNGDPFVDAQDWQIADLRIEMTSTSRRNATGVVTFTNANEPRRLTLDLIKTGDGWRIHEIKAPSGSLRELFKVN